ncbi:alpha/beta fold hydrolase [Shewanella sedimentimangrovi]|uniref:Alpha/beta fold hydrolase n=1 Tax=Shewanella sedimentimangrovi TaxID=2814293 RepID=A0ABX7R570_9GAMM|nr:alpha/beta fold hydrolase [Shewanella sedimentimangrovi]QSX39001.1 alpha/beta fold hydrolase [Shewanella sedimentimangrovi]
MRLNMPDERKGGATDTLVIFAHGAGADMDSDFMADMARGLAYRGVPVLRFNFPYMQKCREDGKRRPPDRAPALMECFAEVLEQARARFKPKRVFLLGKSMGGRMATLFAARPVAASCEASPEASYTQAPIAGVICLGYPFLPPKGKEVRLAPVTDCPVPLLIVQGERDSFGNREQVLAWQLPEKVGLCWIPDGDHSLKPRKASGHSLEGNLALAVDACMAFIGPAHE